MTKNIKDKDIQKLAINFYKSKNTQDFQLLTARIHYGLRSYLFGILKNNEWVDDVEVLILEKIWSKIDLYDPDKAKFSTWLYKVAFNEALQYIQVYNKVHKDILPQDISDIYASSLIGEDSEAFSEQNNIDMKVVNGIQLEFMSKEDVAKTLVDASIDCINKLPYNYRLILKEKLLNEKTLNEIAYDNNIPITSVKNWLFKGRLALRELIKENYSYLYSQYVEYDMI